MQAIANVNRSIWLRWFYRENFLIGTSLARIGFGLVLLYMYLIHYSQRYLLWSDQGLIDHATYLTTTKGFSLSLYTWSPSMLYFDIVYHIGIMVTILYVIGWKGRLMSILFFIFTYSLLDRNYLIGDGGDNILRILLCYMIFANTTAYFSADAEKYWKKRSVAEEGTWYKIKAVFHNFAVLFCIVNLCIMYLTSGLYQIMGEMWHSGTAVYYIMQVNQFSHPFFRNLILQNDFFIVLFTYSSVIIKLAFPFLLFNRYTKYFIVFCVVSFHLGIGIAMGLITFSLIMCIIDFMLISDEEYKKIHRKLIRLRRLFLLAFRTRTRSFGRKSIPQTHHVIVFYDGWCPFCQASIRNLRKLDWFRLLHFVSFREPNVCNTFQLDLNKLEKRMHSKRKTEEKSHEGIYAFIQISKRLVPLWPLVPLLYLAAICGIGQKTYDFIASRRSIIPAGGCDDTCYLPTARTSIKS
ncbi:antimicrobial peptide system protein, SdpB family [Paenibacillus tianmuensis]|uniref:Antimicrobial peptide system protein, SdpB family n=2 Tax=Paenibacillus tianmuensis TaxID=624147 RepID=A0A1G4SRF1_9BACL|nr:antimicrobial peptide system protein, SdpB family [Paenibacillus tianmuensis]